MPTQLEILREQKISKAREALQRVRALRKSTRIYGVDGIRHDVEDVDGDWLKDWTDTEDTQVVNKAQQVRKKHHNTLRV